MRVGVIRGDLPSPLFMGDLEPISQLDFPTEPVGQSRYVSRPDPTTLTNYLSGFNNDGIAIVGFAGVPAGVQSSTAVSFPLSIHGSTGANNVLRVKNSSGGSFTAVTVATATYNTMALLVAAVNAVLTAAIGVVATTDATGTLLVLQSTVVGVGSFVAVDTVGNGSTFNAAVNIPNGGATFTMPSAATIITALLPVGGPLNVSTAAILTNVGASPAAASVADKIAPRFIETEVAVGSFQVGMLSGYLKSTFTPDPNRIPPLQTGAAISVVQDDGVSAFSAPVPNITGAAHNSPNTGDLTITGVGLGNAEFFNSTLVDVINPTTLATARIEQKLIQATVSGGTTGSVTATQIVIPASLLSGLSVAGNTVRLRNVNLGSNTFTIT